MVLKSKRIVVTLSLALVFASSSWANCVANLSGLKGRLSVLAATEQWFEVTARDERPLRVSVTSDEEKIFLSFEKSNERIKSTAGSLQFLKSAAAAGYKLWGEGDIRICPNGDNYIIEFLEGTVSTSNALVIMRGHLKTGARLNLVFNRTSVPNSIQISAGSFWSSTMVPSAN